MHTLRRTIVTTAVIAVGFISVQQIGCRKSVSPEVQKLLDCYNQIDPEMLEGEVDKILSEFHALSSDEVREVTLKGQPLSRASSYTKRYEKADANEYDYFIEVYFDK